MEKKVVVMSGADVAAMRKAHKEAEAAYFDAKVGALEFAVEEMKSTGKEYTLHEVTAMTGLTPMEVVVQFNGGCRAAQKAGVYHQNMRSGVTTTERKFVEVMSDGSVNPESIMTITRRERYYKIVPGGNNGRW
jgi:glycerol-3-phosphate responsive antiterminator